MIYLGTMGDANLYAALARWISELANLQPLLETPPGVEVAERWKGDQRLLFDLNHTDREQMVQLDGSYCELISGKTAQDLIMIAPTDLALLAA